MIKNTEGLSWWPLHLSFYGMNEMSGIYVGGRYVPRSHKVTTFATEFKKYYYYLSNNREIEARTHRSEVEDMYHCAPEPLAFWSKEDD